MADNRVTHVEFVERVTRETQLTHKFFKEILEATTFLVRHELMAGRKDCSTILSSDSMQAG